MKLSPKLILGALFLLVTVIIIHVFSNRSQSSLNLTANENKFNVSFQISDRDKNQATTFLQELSLPRSILDGFEFSLDGTSSAKLAYISPINAKLNLKKDKIQFSGTTTGSVNNTLLPIDLNFKAPNTTTVALFGQNLMPFIEKKITLPPPKNIGGQYLILFNNNPDFALISKKDTFDFTQLESKEVTEGDVTFHLAENYVFFEMGDKIFVTSTFESAKVLALAQKDSSLPANIFTADNTPVSFAVFVQNTKDQKATSAIDFLVGPKSQTKNVIEKIKVGRLFLKKDHFSGSLELLSN